MFSFNGGPRSSQAEGDDVIDVEAPEILDDGMMDEEDEEVVAKDLAESAADEEVEE